MVLAGGVSMLAVSCQEEQVNPNKVVSEIPVEVPAASPGANVQNNTSNWQTYRNPEFGFQISYPPSWRMIQQVNDHFSMMTGIFSDYDRLSSYYVPDDQETKFGIVHIDIMLIPEQDDIKTYSEYYAYKGWHYAGEEVKRSINRCLGQL